jgi:hypothetical protein
LIIYFLPGYWNSFYYLTAKIASQISKRHLSAWNIWTFSRRFSRNLTPRSPKKYFNSICVLFILIIWYGVNAITRTGDFKCHIYLRIYLIKIWCVLDYRRHHTFDVKTCFQQNRCVFDVIVTSWVICFPYFVEFWPRYFDRLLIKYQNVIKALGIFEHFLVVFQEI